MVSKMNFNDKNIDEIINENRQLKKLVNELNLTLQMKNEQIAELQSESQLTFANLAEMVPAAVHVLKGDKFSYINSTFETITGYSKEECLNMNYWDTIHPDYCEMVKQRVLTRRQNQYLPNVRYELKILTKDGQEVWFDHSAGQIKIAGESAIMAVLYDITERKAAEEKIKQQNAYLQETHAELEEMNHELQNSQNRLAEINAKLRESEERLDLALWGTDEGLWDWDMQTEHLYFSDQWAKLLGYEAYELEPHITVWTKRIHPKDICAVQANLDPLIEGKTDTYESEHRIKSKTGEWIWVLDRGKVVTRDIEGKPIRMVGTKRDITLQKNMEAALRASENRYKTLVEAVPEIVAHLNQCGNYIWVNEMGKEFFGDDVCGRHFSKYFIDSEDYQSIAIELFPLIKDYKEIIQLETLMRRKDGQMRLLKWQCKTLKQDGQTIGILSTARDITEKREAEIQLKASEERYRDLFNKSPIGLLKIDRNGNISEINQYYLDLIGPPTKDLITDTNIFSVAQIIPEFGAALSKHLQSFENGQSVSTEIQFTTSWGKRLWIRYKVDPVFDMDGNITEAIIACEEISAWKQAEEKIKYLSYHDALTGVYNRAFFDEELRWINVSRQLPISIIIGDVNGLKLVNDAFGHHMGDKLLITIAQIINDCCREEDIIARWGGDEFAVILPRTPRATAYAICERITAACQQYEPNPILPSIAMGVATKENVTEDIYKVMSAAEDIMYRHKLLESKSIRNSIISSLETSLHEKTFETREHAHRMQSLCIQFGKALGLPGNELDSLSLLANLHDIGKIGIPDSILSKPGPLSEDEWDIIKKHPEIGYRILYSSHELVAIADEVLAHHEKWDGSGYPEGRTSHDIPILSRVLAIVDAYDVMTHERSYKKAISHKEALEEIKRCATSHFDPELARVFIDIFNED